MPLDDRYDMRIDGKEKKDFIEHCTSKLKRPHQDMMREMMVALVEGRLTITRPEEQTQAHGELYE